MSAASPADTATDTPRSAQIGALDGIRGVAVGLVVWLHLRADQMPGGWVGMSVFFPLSGFLMTRLVLNEHHHNDGAVRLRRFWLRRARRLLPAHYAMLVAVGLLLVLGGTWANGDGGAMLSSLLYSNNWWQLGHSVDYWSQFSSRVSPFQHLWSLSVEEQFYVLWPVVMVLAMKRARRPLRAIWLTSCAVAALGLAYGLIITRAGWGGPTDVYYNTGVRGAELLAGSALAALMAGRPQIWTSARARRALDIAAGACLVAIGYTSITLDASASRFIADGGMFVTGIATVIIIASATRGGAVETFLALAPLRWLGTRCYSLYLWHWPIIAMVTRESSGLRGWWLTTAQIVITFAATVLSYWLVEEPIRHGLRATRRKWSRNPVMA
ncbi:unannotated protein [freshwater metagenome]|uniref:Unannotated protein n=1 Tax=freshwater metagenome TaxID=449393 RepID=A0A6J7ERM3_9ZZZZ|nr:acyltransferase family protein [Actinomycetota bacterium]